MAEDLKIRGSIEISTEEATKHLRNLQKQVDATEDSMQKLVLLAKEIESPNLLGRERLKDSIISNSAADIKNLQAYHKEISSLNEELLTLKKLLAKGATDKLQERVSTVQEHINNIRSSYGASRELSSISSTVNAIGKGTNKSVSVGDFSKGMAATFASLDKMFRGKVDNLVKSIFTDEYGALNTAIKRAAETQKTTNKNLSQSTKEIVSLNKGDYRTGKLRLKTASEAARKRVQDAMLYDIHGERFSADINGMPVRDPFGREIRTSMAFARSASVKSLKSSGMYTPEEAERYKIFGKDLSSYHMSMGVPSGKLNETTKVLSEKEDRIVLYSPSYYKQLLGEMGKVVAAYEQLDAIDTRLSGRENGVEHLSAAFKNLPEPVKKLLTSDDGQLISKEKIAEYTKVIDDSIKNAPDIYNSLFEKGAPHAIGSLLNQEAKDALAKYATDIQPEREAYELQRKEGLLAYKEGQKSGRSLIEVGVISPLVDLVRGLGSDFSSGAKLTDDVVAEGLAKIKELAALFGALTGMDVSRLLKNINQLSLSTDLPRDFNNNVGGVLSSITNNWRGQILSMPNTGPALASRYDRIHELGMDSPDFYTSAGFITSAKKGKFMFGLPGEERVVDVSSEKKTIDEIIAYNKQKKQNLLEKQQAEELRYAQATEEERAKIRKERQQALESDLQIRKEREQDQAKLDAKIIERVQKANRAIPDTMKDILSAIGLDAESAYKVVLDKQKKLPLNATAGVLSLEDVYGTHQAEHANSRLMDTVLKDATNYFVDAINKALSSGKLSRKELQELVTIDVKQGVHRRTGKSLSDWDAAEYAAEVGVSDIAKSLVSALADSSSVAVKEINATYDEALANLEKEADEKGVKGWDLSSKQEEGKVKKSWDFSNKQVAEDWAKSNFRGLFGFDEAGLSVSAALANVKDLFVDIARARSEGHDKDYEVALTEAINALYDLFTRGGYRVAVGEILSKKKTAEETGDVEAERVALIQAKTLSTLLNMRSSAIGALEFARERVQGYWKETSDGGEWVPKSAKERMTAVQDSGLDLKTLMEMMAFITSGYTGLNTLMPQAFNRVAEGFRSNEYEYKGFGVKQDVSSLADRAIAERDVVVNGEHVTTVMENLEDSLDALSLIAGRYITDAQHLQTAENTQEQDKIDFYNEKVSKDLEELAKFTDSLESSGLLSKEGSAYYKGALERAKTFSTSAEELDAQFDIGANTDLTGKGAIAQAYVSFMRKFIKDAEVQVQSALDAKEQEELEELKKTSVDGVESYLNGVRDTLRHALFGLREEELVSGEKKLSSIPNVDKYAPIFAHDERLSSAYSNLVREYGLGEEFKYSKEWKDLVLGDFKELETAARAYYSTVRDLQISDLALTEATEKKKTEQVLDNLDKQEEEVTASVDNKEAVPNDTKAPVITAVPLEHDWATEATLKSVQGDLRAFISAVSGKEVNYFKEQSEKAKGRDLFSTEDLIQIEKISGAYPELISNFSRINAEDVHQMEEQFRQAAKAIGVTVDDLVHKEENGVRQITATIHKGTEEAKITVKQAGEETKATVEDVEKKVKGSSDRTIASLQSIVSMLSPLLRGLGIKQLISAAGAAEKALKSLQATTGKYAKQALAMVDTLNEAYGMSKTQAAQALTYAYNQISEVGISNNQALQMSDALVQLGADYSAYYGGAKSAMEVTQALTQVMLGSYRAARQYGIAISSTDVEQLAIAYGKQANNLSEAEKMLYRYQVVMSRASNVMGEYERTSGTYFNAQQELNKAWADAKIALGDNLLPYATSALTLLTDLADSLGSGGLSGSLLVATVTLTSAASAFLKLTKSVEGLAKAMGTSSLALGGWLSIVLTALTAVVLLASRTEKKAEEDRKAAAAAYAHADAIDAVAEATQKYTAAIGTSEEAVRKQQLMPIVAELGQAYKENQDKIKEEQNKRPMPFDSSPRFGVPELRDRSKANIKQYTEQSDASLSAMLSTAQGLLPYVKDIGATIDMVTSMTGLEGEYLDEVKKYLKENLSIYDAIAANAKAVVDYSSKLETAEKNLVSLAQKRLESRNELYEAYKIELQYLDEVYNKELDIAKEAASNTLTVNMESAITNAKHALDYAKGDDDTEALADRLEQLQNADLNEIEVFVTDEMNAEGFKGTEEQLGAIRKQLMDMYGFEETEAALIVGAYKSMTDRQKLYLKESEKLLLDYIDKQDVAENELKKNELETIGGDIYQSMDARRQAYSDLLELQNDEVNTAYTNQVALINKALSEGKISQEEYNAYMDRAERKRLRDSKANFDSYVNNIKNATDEIANTRRELLSGRASDIGDAQSVYDLAKESADITYQNAVINKADLLRTEIDSIFKQLPFAEGEEYEQLLVRYAAAYKELISITGETAAEQAAYNERVQEAKDNAYLEYIRALSAAFDEYAHSIISAKTPLEEFNEATRTLAEHAVDQTSDPTGAITAYRNTRQAIWDAQSNINTLREASASAISRFEKEDKYRGKIDFKRLADANASGELAAMNIEDFLTVPKGEVDTEEMEAFLKEYADKTKDIARNEFADVADAIAEGLTQGLSAIDELLSMNAENEQTQIQNRISALKKAYDDMKEQMEKRNDQSYDNLTRSQKDAIERQKKMDEEELERQQALIEEQEAMLEDAKRKEFERQKAFNIAEATIAGIKGAIDAYTSMASIPYVGAALGIAAAAAVTAFTAAKINAIASQEYQASYAQGAYNLPQDQTAQVHKGEMIIPRPFAQELRDEVSGNSSYSSSDEITINVYGATDDVSVESNTVEGNQQLDIYLTQRVKTMVARGELDNALQTRYSISKNGRRS